MVESRQFQPPQHSIGILYQVAVFGADPGAVCLQVSLKKKDFSLKRKIIIKITMRRVSPKAGRPAGRRLTSKIGSLAPLGMK